MFFQPLLPAVPTAPEPTKPPEASAQREEWANIIPEAEEEEGRKAERSFSTFPFPLFQRRCVGVGQV